MGQISVGVIVEKSGHVEIYKIYALDNNSSSAATELKEMDKDRS
jgi:hypothetical protein